MNKVYLKDWGRPFGLEPTIYNEYPEQDNEVYEIEPGYFIDVNPFGFTVLEFNSIEDAKQYVKENTNE